jgi:hypothetical protein
MRFFKELIIDFVDNFVGNWKRVLFCFVFIISSPYIEGLFFSNGVVDPSAIKGSLKAWFLMVIVAYNVKRRFIRSHA